MDSFDKKKKQGSGGSRPSDKRGGGGAGHPDTEIIGGGGLGLKKTFSPFGPQFGLIIRGKPGPPGPSPGPAIARYTNKRE